MRKRLLFVMLGLALAGSLSAQESQFGILFGGSKRTSVKLRNDSTVKDDFSLSNSVKEIYYSAPLDPLTRFKIKAGRIDAPAAFRVVPANASSSITRDFDVKDAEIEHVDGLIEYRFDEPFGSAGMFLGAGLYRQKGTFTETVNGVAQSRSASETDYGFSGGVNGDFPLTRNLGIVLEGTYHWVKFKTSPRYLTLGAGMRFSF